MQGSCVTCAADVNGYGSSSLRLSGWRARVSTSSRSAGINDWNDSSLSSRPKSRNLRSVRSHPASDRPRPSVALFLGERSLREQLGPELVGRRRAHLELEQSAHFDLADALARQVHDLADLFERDAAALGDIECARVL